MRTDRIVAAKRILDKVKLEKLSAADKAAAVKAYRSLRKEAEEYEELQKVAIEKAKPEGFDEMHSRHESGRLTVAEEAEYEKKLTEFNRAVGLTLVDEGAREREPQYNRLSAEAMERLMESNPELTLAEIDLLHVVLAEGE